MYSVSMYIIACPYVKVVMTTFFNIKNVNGLEYIVCTYIILYNGKNRKVYFQDRQYMQV